MSKVEVGWFEPPSELCGHTAPEYPMNVTAGAIQRISTLASVTLAFTTAALAQYEQIQELGSADGHVMVSGDFNGDGIADVAFGNRFTEVVRVFLSPSMLEIQLTDPTASAAIGFGTALAAGDLDNDGDDELVVTANDVVPGGGVAYVYAGGPTGPTLSVSIGAPVTTPAQLNFGSSATITPDTDNNGFAEVVVGAPGLQLLDPGGVFFFDVSGALTGGSPPVMTKSIIPSALTQAGIRRFGLDVEGGDFDNDGFGGVAVIWVSLALSNGGVISHDEGNPLNPGSGPPGISRRLVSWHRNGNQPISDMYEFSPGWNNVGLSMANTGDLEASGTTADDGDDLVLGDSRNNQVILYTPETGLGTIESGDVTMIDGLPNEELGREVVGIGDLNVDGRGDALVVGKTGRVRVLSGGPRPSQAGTWQRGFEMGSFQAGGTALLHLLSSSDYNGDGFTDFAFYDAFLDNLSLVSFASLQPGSVSTTANPLYTQGLANGVCLPIFLQGSMVGATSGVVLASSNDQGQWTNHGLSLPFPMGDPLVRRAFSDPTFLVSTNPVALNAAGNGTSGILKAPDPNADYPGGSSMPIYFGFYSTNDTPIAFNNTWLDSSDTTALEIVFEY